MKDETLKILLCKTMNYTIADYINDCNQGNKKKMAKFIYKRFSERYIEPFEAIEDKKEKKNGFSLMAIACLMIEALESFWQGLPDTQYKSKKMFKDFFSHCFELKDFIGLEEQFYENIRCGILHQAETRAGWKISRERNIPLLDKERRIINATKFQTKLKSYLERYKKELETQDLSSSIWKNFKKKMKTVIKNCQM